MLEGYQERMFGVQRLHPYHPGLASKQEREKGHFDIFAYCFAVDNSIVAKLSQRIVTCVCVCECLC